MKRLAYGWKRKGSLGLQSPILSAAVLFASLWAVGIWPTGVVRTAAAAAEAPSLRARSNRDQAVQLFDDGKYQAALAPLEQACLEYAFSECLFDLATVHHSLGQCEGLAFYKQYLQQELAPEDREEVQTSCEFLSEDCNVSPEASCQQQDKALAPGSENVSENSPFEPHGTLSAVDEGTPQALIPLQSIGAVAVPQSTEGSPALPSATPTPLLPSGNPTSTWQGDNHQWVAGVSLVGLGVVAGAASGVAWLQFANEDAGREISNVAGKEAALYEQTRRAKTLCALAIGLGAASGILISTGTFLWWSDRVTTQWNLVGGETPRLNLSGTF